MVENIQPSYNFSLVKVAFIKSKIYEQLGRLYGNVEKGVYKRIRHRFEFQVGHSD